MSSDDVAIKVSNLSKCFQIYDTPRDRLKQFILPRLQRLAGRAPQIFFREFRALDGISFEVKKGETVGIIGRNGSGKSTLLQLICGILSPTNGATQSNGRVASLLELGSGFNPEFTGRENVYMNAMILGLEQKEIDERYDAIASFANIGDFIDQPVKIYSSGMYVRLGFAVAINVEPDVLIIDEALAVGDFSFQIKCLSKLKILSDSGTTILFVTHDISQIQKICDRALYLKNGQQSYFGNTKTAADRYFYDLNANDANEENFQIPDDHATDISSELGKVEKSLFRSYTKYIDDFQRGSQKDGKFLYVSINGMYKSEPQVNFGEEIGIEIIFVLKTKKIKNPAISFYVIDNAGQLLTGSNTILEKIDLREAEIGQHLRLTVKFENRFREGKYGLRVYLVDHESNETTEYIDYIELAAQFTSSCPAGQERWAFYNPALFASLENFE